MDFKTIKDALARQFATMQKQPVLFRTAVAKDDLWSAYLGAFTPEQNPIFRVRTEHDGSYDRQFIKAVGNVVAIIDGKLVTIWDVQAGEYQPIVDAMATLVKAAPITDLFRHEGRTVGIDQSFEEVTIDGTKQAITWTHFFSEVDPKFVLARSAIPAFLGEARSTRDVVFRGFTEITPEAVDTVLDLIAQNSLYRGEEHKAAVEGFKAAQAKFSAGNDLEKQFLAWTTPFKVRSMAIGTLLVDLSEGRELEAAVASFEAKVAPTNYKRPTTLVTPAMVAKAKEEVEALGLTSALSRRHAVLGDITANNVLFVDRGARPALDGGGAFDDLPTKAGAQTFDKVEEVTVERFLSEVLPRAGELEVLVENRHAGNFVSLIAPADPEARHLFKWDNPFSWSYAGEFADAIKERVKKAGGNVTGDLCCRLAWSNFDDLDLHLQEPGRNGEHIHFRHKASFATGGQLDVDMNAGGGQTREPVENIFYRDRGRMIEGVYTLSVNQFARRESKDVGFEVEIDYLGGVQRFAYPSAVRQDETVVVAKFEYVPATGLRIIESLPATTLSREVWGLPTETFHRVNVVMNSPNHWDGQGVGNRHLFFMLDGCANDGSARGFYNEFLPAALEPHRKVLELVGGKMKVPDVAEQLSGLGFSSTSKNSLVVRVKGSFNRTIKVLF